MTEQCFDIRRVGIADQAYKATLILAAGESRPADMATTVWLTDLLDQRDFEPLGQGLVFGAFMGSELCAATLAVESHGHCALVSYGTTDNTSAARSAVSQCLRVLRETAKTTSIEILQVITDTGDSLSRGILQAAGFKYITKLVYLIKKTKDDNLGISTQAELTLLPYSHENKRKFCDALESSYLGSFDCPELSGKRVTEDVLMGHRPRKGFDPSLWQVAMRGDKPIGVLLLNSLSPQRALEIVYIGVSPDARGTGVSDELMARALIVAKHCSVDFITLAVDVRNKPALELYARWQYERCLERDAWLSVS